MTDHTLTTIAPRRGSYHGPRAIIVAERADRIRAEGALVVAWAIAAAALLAYAIAEAGIGPAVLAVVAMFGLRVAWADAHRREPARPLSFD
jgi:hypothetical protein